MEKNVANNMELEAFLDNFEATFSRSESLLSFFAIFCDKDLFGARCGPENTAKSREY